MSHLLVRVFTLKTFFGFTLLIILTLPAIAIAEESENQEPFYKNVSANIEMRLVLEPEDKDTSWLYLQDLEGTSHKVSEEILIDSSDVEGASIRKENREEIITLYFYETSWKHLFEVTTQIRGKRLAIVKGGEIFSAPMVFDPLLRAAQITGISLPSTDKFLQGFVLSDRPSHLDSESPYRDFLANWISTHPDDLKLKQTLAYSYIHDKESPELEKAIPLFEELATANPQESHFHTELVLAYTQTYKFDRALSAAETALKFLPKFDQTFMYGLIGEIYILKGEKDHALKFYEIYLKKAKDLKMPKFRTTEETIQFEKIIGKPVPRKSDLIEQIKNRIEYIRNH